MGKLSSIDKLMRIQTLREQRLGAKTILAAYPDKRARSSAQWIRFASMLIKRGRQ